jgi:hypothetical protein
VDQTSCSNCEEPVRNSCLSEFLIVSAPRGNSRAEARMLASHFSGRTNSGFIGADVCLLSQNPALKLLE